jgi:hypothetical protein
MSSKSYWVPTISALAIRAMCPLRAEQKWPGNKITAMIIARCITLPIHHKLKSLLWTYLAVAAFLVGLCQASLGQVGDTILESRDSTPSPTPSGSRVATLFQNVRIFDGKSDVLSAPSDVLVRGNTIERISASPITVDKNDNVRIIAANGRVLMPGLIDAHWHAFMAATSLQTLITSSPSYLHLLAAREAESVQYTEPEIRAAVEAADNWGT